jgi:hypothetical protein
LSFGSRFENELTSLFSVVPPGKRIAEHGQRKIGALLKGGDSLHRRQTSTARLVSDGNKWPTIAFGTAKVVPKPWMKQVALHET